MGDLIISEDIETTESYVGVGADNLIESNISTEIDLSLAKKSRHKRKKSNQKKNFEDTSRSTDTRLSYNVPLPTNENDTARSKSSCRSKTPISNNSVPSLPELKARFDKIEKEIPVIKAQTISQQIEKLESKKHKVTLNEKLKQMKEIKTKGQQNWSVFKSEIKFVEKLEENNKQYEDLNLIKKEETLNDMIEHIEMENTFSKLNDIKVEEETKNKSVTEIPKVVEETDPIEFNTIIKPMIHTSLKPTPITAEVAMELKQVFFNSPSRSWGSEWYRQSFEFHTSNSKTPYGLIQKTKGPNSIMAVVQAEFLIQAIFNCGNHHNWIQNLKIKRVDILINTLVSIISRSRPNTNSPYILCLLDKELRGRKLNLIKEDGLTECIVQYKLDNERKLLQCIEHHINQFIDSTSPGLILLVISCVLTYGLVRCKEEIYNQEKSNSTRLISPVGYPRVQLFNLMMSGSFTSHLFNQELSSLSNNHGIQRRSSIGFLTLRKHCSLCSEIGIYLKTPRYPIWLLEIPFDNNNNGDQNNEYQEFYYCLAFCTNRKLVSDWKCEIRFKLHLYSPLFSNDYDLSIIVDSSKSAIEKQKAETEQQQLEEEKRIRQKELLKEKLSSMNPDALKYILDDNENLDLYIETNIAPAKSMIIDNEDKDWLMLCDLIHLKWPNGLLEFNNNQTETIKKLEWKLLFK